MMTCPANLIDSDDLELISVNSVDLDFVDNLLGESDYVCDERTVISESVGETKDTREVIVTSDTDSDNECTEGTENRRK